MSNRYLIRAAVCVLLGTITAMLVAWSCALGPDPGWRDERLRGYFEWEVDNTFWQVHLFVRNGSAVLFSSRDILELTREQRVKVANVLSKIPVLRQDELPAWSRFQHTPTAQELAEYREVWREHAYGWPFLCAVYRQETDWQQRDAGGNLVNSPRPSRTTSAITLTPSTPIIRRWDNLPTGILWAGYVADLTLYSMAAGALLVLPTALKPQIRKRRACCMECGYPVGESAVCAECGKPFLGRTALR